jgi:hypothetical protein
VLTGDGLPAALSDVETVLHLATTLRGRLAGAAKLPIMPVLAGRAQPVDVRDVATHLVERSEP